MKACYNRFDYRLWGGRLQSGRPRPRRGQRKVSMAKKISVALSVLATCLLVFVILFTSMQFVMNQRSFISHEYNKLMLAKEMGISNDELVKSYFRLVDYMQGTERDIGIFVTQNGEKITMFPDEQEISHMKDVRTLYQRVKGFRDIAAIVMLVLYTASAVLALRTAAHSIAKGCMIGIFIALMPIGFIATWAALDFSNFWDFFHKALFWNEDWLFPATSRMIQILPEQFFMDLVLRIVLFAGGAIVLLLAVSWIVISATHRREEREYERAIATAKRKHHMRKKRERALQQRAERAKQSGTETAGDPEMRKRRKKKTAETEARG